MLRSRMICATYLDEEENEENEMVNMVSKYLIYFGIGSLINSLVVINLLFYFDSVLGYIIKQEASDQHHH